MSNEAKPAKQPQMIQVHITPKPPEPDPHRHRPAYLAAGGVACYDCGLRLR